MSTATLDSSPIVVTSGNNTRAPRLHRATCSKINVGLASPPAVLEQLAFKPASCCQPSARTLADAAAWITTKLTRDAQLEAIAAGLIDVDSAETGDPTCTITHADAIAGAAAFAASEQSGSAAIDREQSDAEIEMHAVHAEVERCAAADAAIDAEREQLDDESDAKLSNAIEQSSSLDQLAAALSDTLSSLDSDERKTYAADVNAAEDALRAASDVRPAPRVARRTSSGRKSGDPRADRASTITSSTSPIGLLVPISATRYPLTSKGDAKCFGPCGKIKPVTSFGTTSDGREIECRACRYERGQLNGSDAGNAIAKPVAPGFAAPVKPAKAASAKSTRKSDEARSYAKLSTISTSKLRAALSEL